MALTILSDALKRFLKLEASGGIVLVAAAAFAMLLANGPLAFFYTALLDLPVAVLVGALEIHKPLILWINDGLMAVFFLLVGLEIKREVAQGELSSIGQAALPAIGAVGGMAVPALVYVLLNLGHPPNLAGWAIPSATDIAFALGVLALMGNRAPASLKLFLLALAVMDDLGAIVIIALFYTADLSTTALALAGIAVAGLAALNMFGVRKLGPYLLVGVFLWVCVLKSGVHATLAGVVVGLAIPLKGGTAGDLEHKLHPWVAYLILPVFAFANAGVPLAGVTLGALLQPVPLGIMLGLFVGKQVGIFTTCWLAIRLGWAKLPEGATWLQFYGVGVLAGIGFTMSLFIGTLAFPEEAGHGAGVRLGVLSGSLLSAVLGAGVLWLAGKPRVTQS
ncbi:MAG TPA: Na+/H+ antiporter NhaA [Candidatus Omnitrophota bacterium]|nr:Na+/H+ antiporter NhaA [Candidatus Omnitrophota bacterium]